MRNNSDNNIPPREILRFLALGGVLIAAIVAPNMIKGFKFLFDDKNYISWKKFNCSRVKQSVNRLKRRGLVKSQIKNKALVVALTNKGKQELLRYDFDEMRLKKAKSWDGKWRIVIFDIPEFRKVARDALRRKFNFLGMYQLQKSVFIYPYDCKREIDFISGFYDIGDYIFYLESEIKDMDAKLRKVFRIQTRAV